MLWFLLSLTLAEQCTNIWAPSGINHRFSEHRNWQIAFETSDVEDISYEVHFYYNGTKYNRPIGTFKKSRPSITIPLGRSQFRNIYGLTMVDVEFQSDSVACNVTTDYTALMQLEVINISSSPTFYTPNSIPNITTFLYDHNANPNQKWKISILNSEEEYVEYNEEEINEVQIKPLSISLGNDTFKLSYPSENEEEENLFHISDVGNYTVSSEFLEEDDDSSKIVKREVSFYIRNRMQIQYIKSNKGFYFAGEDATLTFQFLTDEDPDTWYNVHANNVMNVVHETNRQPFTITIQIPVDAPIGDYTFNYNVSVADVIWSDNNNAAIHVRAKPILTNPITDETYLKDDEIIVSVTCNDQDDNDKFNVFYKVNDASEFQQLETIPADESKVTILKIKVNNAFLKHGNNEVFIKVVDSFGIESDQIKAEIKIVSKPVIQISGQSDFYEVGDNITLHIDLFDEDDNDYANISYSFGDDNTNQTSLQNITFPSDGHIFNGSLETFKIPDTRAGPLNLTIFATDKFGRTSYQTIVLIIHKRPIIMLHNSENERFVPGKTYSLAFNISDEDLPNDQINISYKLGDNDYQYALTYIENVTKEFNVTIPPEYPSGSATLFVKAVDNYTLSDEKNLTVYIKHKPDITIDELQKPYFTGGDFIEFSGKYSDEDGDKGKIYLYSDIGNSSSEEINNGENFTIKLRIPNEKQTGSITVYVYGEDSDGLTSEKRAVTFTVKSTPKFSECRNDKDIYKVGDSVTVTCTITDYDEGDVISYGTYNDENGEFTQKGSDTVSGNSITVEFGPYIIPDGFTEPHFDVTLGVIDSFEFKSNKTIQIPLKNRPKIVSKSADKEYYLRGETIVLTVNVTDEDDTDTITVTAKYGDVTNKSTQNTVKDSESQFKISLKIPDDAAIGTMTITISASDSTNIQAEDVNMDLPLYFRPILRPTNPDQIFKSGETATISVTIQDLDSPETVNLKYKYEGMSEFVEITPGIQINSGTATTQIEVHLPSKYSGVLQIELIGTDSHSLESSSSFANVTIRNVPKLYITSDVPTISSGDNLTITGFISDYDPDESFTFHIDNGTYDSVLNRTSENTSFTIQIPITNSTTGKRSVDIYIEDKYGFRTEPHSFVFYMRARPQVEIYPIPGKHVRGRPLEFTFKIKDDDEDDSSMVKIKYNNKEITTMAKKLLDDGRIPTTSEFENHSLNIEIPMDSKFGNSTLEIIAIDKYNLESIPDSSAVYILQPPALIYGGTDRDDLKPGDNISTSFKVKDTEGDNNISISLQLPNGTVIGPINNECLLDTDMKSSCNDKDTIFNFSIPNSTNDGDFPIIAVLNDTYGQSSKFPVTLGVMNYPPEVEIVNKDIIQRSSFTQNQTITIKYKIRDNNTNDYSRVYISIYKSGDNKANHTQLLTTLETNKNWTEYNYSFEIPNDGDYLFDIYLIDKNGKTSNNPNASINIVDPGFQGINAKGFEILVRRRWIILVVISVIIMLILLAILIIIILLIPCGEVMVEEEEEENIEEPVDWPSMSDSGETVSVDTDEIEEYNVQA